MTSHEIVVKEVNVKINVISEQNIITYVVKNFIIDSDIPGAFATISSVIPVNLVIKGSIFNDGFISVEKELIFTPFSYFQGQKSQLISQQSQISPLVSIIYNRIILRKIQ